MILKTYDEDPSKLTFENFRHVFRENLKNIPGSKYNSKKEQWFLPKTWQTMLAVFQEMHGEVELSDELRQWYIDVFQQTIHPQLEVRDSLKPTIEFPPQFDRLYPYQLADIEFITRAKRVSLMNDMGLGKTASSISSLRYAYEVLGEDVFPILVVSPNTVKYNWEKEFNMWWPGLDIVVIDGTKAKRTKQFKDPHQVYIMNWESVAGHSRLQAYGSVALKKCQDHGGLDPKVKSTTCQMCEKELNFIDFGAVIGDEVHKIKNPKTNTARAFKSATGDATYRIGLTGTPINKDVSEMFSMLNWLMPEAYPSKVKMIDRFFNTVVDHWGNMDITGFKSTSYKEEFFKGVDPYSRRLPVQAAIDFLPDKIFTVRDVELSPKQKKAYDELKKKYMTVLNSDGFNPATLQADTGLTIASRLSQLAVAYGTLTGDVTFDMETGEIIDTTQYQMTEPSSTLDAFVDDMESFGDESVVVFARNIDLIEMLATRFEKMGVRYGRIDGTRDAKTNEHSKDLFQNGDVQYILCGLDAANSGITLTKGSVVCYLQRPMSNIQNQQSERRAWRIGSEIHDRILYIDYFSNGTIQSDNFNRLVKNNNNLQSILRDSEVLKKILENDDILGDEK